MLRRRILLIFAPEINYKNVTILFTLTSCDTDQKIANYLITGNWKGNLDTYYTNRWGDAFLDGEYYTVWRFEPGGYDDWGYVTSGYGTEADYNVYDDREFAYSSFRWEVRNGNIYIYYDDPTWNNVRIDWRDYSISSSRFRGTMYDWEERIYNFDLANVGYWDSTYVGENGSSVATGRFAKALKEMSNK